MNNNTMSHKAIIVNQYFEAETLKKIEQPSKKAAIYLIKHVWGVFQRSMQKMESYYIPKRQSLQLSLSDLCRAVL